MSRSLLAAAALASVAALAVPATAEVTVPVEALGTGKGVAVVVDGTCPSGYVRIAGPFNAGAHNLRVCQKGIN